MLLVIRYEYANIYHAMADWYNAFLLMSFFNYAQAETNILLLDGHPKSSLDPVWRVLFNSTHRLSGLKPVSWFKELTFNILGRNSYLHRHHEERIPLIDEFSKFFLESYRIPYNKKKLDCDRISVLFIWRRDYVAHPRNPSGNISRKIANEDELIGSLQMEHPDFHIQGVRIDLFDMQQQLKYIAESDVLIGMHGAGLILGLFLPKHGGIIELFPKYWDYMPHFKAIARWKSLKYEYWKNEEPRNETPNGHTIIPFPVLHGLFRTLLHQMGCIPTLDET